MREAVSQVPHTEFEKLSLEGFISCLRSAGLKDLTELVCHGDGRLFVVTVTSEIGDELSGLDRVVWLEQLSGTTEKVVYLCKVVPEVEEGVKPMQGRKISSSEIQVGQDDIEVTIIGEQDNITRDIEACEDAGCASS